MQVWFLQNSILLRSTVWKHEKLKVYKINVFFSPLPSLIIFKFCFYKIVFFWILLYENMKNSKCIKLTSFFQLCCLWLFLSFVLQISVFLKSTLWKHEKLKVYKINVFFSTLPSLIIFKFCFYKIVFSWSLLYEKMKNSKYIKLTSFFNFAIFDYFQLLFQQNTIVLKSFLWNHEKKEG
jgi:hypothetical protein